MLTGGGLGMGFTPSGNIAFSGLGAGGAGLAGMAAGPIVGLTLGKIAGKMLGGYVPKSYHSYATDIRDATYSAKELMDNPNLVKRTAHGTADPNQLYMGQGVGSLGNTKEVYTLAELQSMGYKGAHVGGMVTKGEGDQAIGDFALMRDQPQAPAPAPAPAAPAAPRRRAAPAPTAPKPAAPAPQQKKRDEITKPATGLEGTIKWGTGSKLEERDQNYLEKTRTSSLSRVLAKRGKDDKNTSGSMLTRFTAG